MEPIIFIDEQSKDPISRQIVEQVRHHVATGVLSPGDELPSLR
jgi:DNA-binding transcriptional regulator YhcF (GntR family)